MNDVVVLDGLVFQRPRLSTTQILGGSEAHFLNIQQNVPRQLGCMFCFCILARTDALDDGQLSETLTNDVGIRFHVLQ